MFPSHLAESYGLVVIIALGEQFVAIGIGTAGIGLGMREVAAAILGLLVATSFWLAYFDFFSIRGARMLALHAYELVWWREARAESRSMLTSP